MQASRQIAIQIVIGTAVGILASTRTDNDNKPPVVGNVSRLGFVNPSTVAPYVGRQQRQITRARGRNTNGPVRKQGRVIWSATGGGDARDL